MVCARWMGEPSQMTSSRPGRSRRSCWLEEAHHVVAAEAAEAGLLHVQEQPPVRGDGADGAEVVARQRHPQRRRLPGRGVGAHHAGQQAGQQIERGLVYEDEKDGALLAAGFAESAGHRSVHQARMIASSRWVARVWGCWGLQPICRSSRVRLAGW